MQTIKQTIAVCIGHWRQFILTGERDEARTAYRVCAASQRKNASDLRLYWLAVFLAVELGNFDKAGEMLYNIYRHRSYFKNHREQDYAALLFLYAYLEVKQKRSKSAKKHMRALEELEDLAESSRRREYKIMLGLLHQAFYESAASYRMFADAYKQGNRSVFLFAGLYKYYRGGGTTNGELLLQTVTWALGHGAEADDSVLLREICLQYMAKGDYSVRAYEYYVNAVRRQVHLPDLPQFIVKAAFENGQEKIHHYTMSQFLRTGTDDIALKTFAFHLLLTDKNNYNLVPVHVNEILTLARFSLNREMRSRYLNSLYLFLWLKSTDTAERDRVLGVLEEDLFKFEVHDPSGTVKRLYITEKDRQKTLCYSFPEGVHEIIIEAASGGFSYICWGDDGPLDVQLQIKSKIAAVNTELYKHFYEKGARDFGLICYLAKHYISLGEYSPVLEEVLNFPETSETLKAQISMALGTESIQGKFEQREIGRLAYKLLLETASDSPAGAREDEDSPRPEKEAYLLKIVLKYFEGTQQQWLKLAALNNPQINEKIITNAIRGSHFDSETQRIFAKQEESRAQAEYRCFVVYKIIADEETPIPETIAALENAYRANKDPLLAYALCHAYRNSPADCPDDIVEDAALEMEREKIIFPVFKSAKLLRNAYTEKYSAFMYRTLPGKYVRMYYRVDGGGTWHSTAMKYWRFGLYLVHIPHFYNEALEYYYSEEMSSGSITTRPERVENKEPLLIEGETPDSFFTVNNAIIYEHMFKYDKVEEIIGGLVRDLRVVRGGLV